jgi:COP9 signalosome complex subunit 6
MTVGQKRSKQKNRSFQVFISNFAKENFLLKFIEILAILESFQLNQSKMEVDKPVESMEVDDVSASSSRKQILAKTIQPSVVISLHPLVLMNISEHWTRYRAQEGSALQVYGALIGKQEGRKIEVFNSFELKYEKIDEDVIINRDYYNTKEEQCKSKYALID